MNILLFVVLAMPITSVASGWEERARQEAYRPGFTQGEQLTPSIRPGQEALPIPREANKIEQSACDNANNAGQVSGSPGNGQNRSAENIRRIMERHGGALDASYQRWIRSHQGAQGSIVVNIKIDALGNVVDVVHRGGNKEMAQVFPVCTSWVFTRHRGIRAVV